MLTFRGIGKHQKVNLTFAISYQKQSKHIIKYQSCTKCHYNETGTSLRQFGDIYLV